MLAESFLRSGKVRDLYSVPGGRLVLTASDRISAFDVVLPSLIPDKGRVLTGLSRFWFAETAGIVPNHLLDTDIAVLRDAFAARWEARTAMAGASEAARRSVSLDLSLDDLRGRVMICRPTQVIPIEAVVRGYLAGSGWKEYREHGAVCGIPLPPGLQESGQLPEPIFTPATKAELGDHDENVDFDRAAEIVGDRALLEELRRLSIAIYERGATHARERGIILADTKFEFGRRADGTIVLGDEVMTPDSSRFWPADGYEPGRGQPSFDKQYVRDWASASGWDKSPPAPEIPDEVVAGTRERYVEAYERIAGEPFERWLERSGAA